MSGETTTAPPPDTKQKKQRVKVIVDDGLPYDIKKHDELWFMDEPEGRECVERRREGEPDDLFKERKIACIQWKYFTKRWAECLADCDLFLGEKEMKLQKSEITEVNDFRDKCIAKLSALEEQK